MKALITGINGFVGTHLAEHLLASGDDVIGSGLTAQWRRDAPQAVREQCPILAWDISAPAADELIAEVRNFRPDCIFHLAAISAPADCGKTEANTAAQAVNVDGTRHVLDLAAALRDRPRVVLASSAKVYAPVSADNPRVDENSPVRPADGYAKTKHQAEQLTRDAIRDAKLNAVIVRAFQHTGPRQEPRFMLPEWVGQLVQRESQTLRVQNLDSFLDITDVRDVARAYRLLAEPDLVHDIYNVGSGIQRRSGDILQRLLQLGGYHQRVEESSPGRRQNPIADITRIMADTGWRPAIDLDATLKDTLDYWRQETSL